MSPMPPKARLDEVTQVSPHSSPAHPQLLISHELRSALDLWARTCTWLTLTGETPTLTTLAKLHQTPITTRQNAPTVEVIYTTVMFSSVSDGLDNEHLTSLFETCGPLTAFTRWMKRSWGSRLPTPVGYGFVEYRDPEGALRSIALLDEIELPALQEGCESKRLFVRAADRTTKALLGAYDALRIKTAADEASTSEAQKQIDLFICSLQSAPIIPANCEPQFTLPLPFCVPKEVEPRGEQPQILREIELFKLRAAKRRKIREDQANAQAYQLSPSTNVELDQNSQSHTSPSSSKSSSSIILPQSLGATSAVPPLTEESSVDEFHGTSHTSPTISRSSQYLQTEEAEKENNQSPESSVNGVDVINNISLKRKRHSEVESVPVQATETSRLPLVDTHPHVTEDPIGETEQLAAPTYKSGILKEEASARQADA